MRSIIQSHRAFPHSPRHTHTHSPAPTHPPTQIDAIRRARRTTRDRRESPAKYALASGLSARALVRTRPADHGHADEAMRTRTSALRASGSAAAPAPYRSDANFDYFRSARTLGVTLPKPLGAVLEEVAPAGVRVEELQEGGSAMETGLLKKGDKFLSVLGEDVSSSSFDEVMALLMASPDDKPVEITVRRVVITRKPRATVAAPRSPSRAVRRAMCSKATFSGRL